MITIKEDKRSMNWQVGDTFKAGGEIYIIGKDRYSLYRVVSINGFISCGYYTIEELLDMWWDGDSSKIDLECTIK